MLDINILLIKMDQNERIDINVNCDVNGVDLDNFDVKNLFDNSKKIAQLERDLAKINERQAHLEKDSVLRADFEQRFVNISLNSCECKQKHEQASRDEIKQSSLKQQSFFDKIFYFLKR